MEAEGKPTFLKFHQGSVRGVAFHPQDHFLFCSGAYDGKINLYSAQRYEFLQTYSVSNSNLARNINAVRFTCDGGKIVSTSTSRRLSVIDVEKGEQVLTYDNCAFSGRDRTGLAANPASPNLITCVSSNGRGLTLFDLRMQLPLDFLFDVHSGIIRDVLFLHESWPWCQLDYNILTVGSDGLSKVSTLDGRCVHAVNVGESMNAATVSPEAFNSSVEDGFSSVIVYGGDTASSYVPEVGIQEKLSENNNNPVWKVRYNSSGSLLYTACERGVIRKYRRWPDRHEYLGEVFRHKSDVQDMDISPYNEYLVTASRDRTVGVIKLGGPNHGPWEYYELT
ncbi:hypothetical protein CAPTEDRAFT_226153 [Capitella teleta]|uniref:Uncharacterized protein n=1 Tax=Capitella teleta TaxID=283909 RepID=R7V0G5_CAPTE|nr:hypothetical protein CAPTEDRAFT_226153 [Capitella teleta]|eukprot:ELU09697.1 hypothetical protein CAPTEDRAFT_226153 [Capitella teleta]